MTLAVDAFNLAADRRGMGRSVRRILSSLRTFGEDDIRLVVRSRREARDLAREFDYPSIEPRDLSRAPPSAVWYPWNGMRFKPHARAIVTIHDPFAFTFPHRNFWARRREQAPIRRALRDADVLLAVSHWTKQEIMRLFHISSERIRVVPNAPDPIWRPVESHAESPYFFFAAGPEKRKNAAFLFSVFAGAFAEGGPRLIVTGDMSEAGRRALSEMANAKYVAVGNDAQLRELYSGALAVLVPSLGEGYGFTAIEAMACGAPVIAADAAALPETCAGAAILVAPSDAAAWGDAIRSIAQDSALREHLRERGLAHAATIDPDAPAKGLLDAMRA